MANHTKHRGLMALVPFMVLAMAAVTRASTYVIPFQVRQAGKVSVCIYNADGVLVRELLHAVPKTAGRHAVVWDGLDAQGQGVPMGEYAWKLLQTPGLKATYLMTVGTNFPPGETWRTASGPGTHGTPFGIASDDTGIYVSAETTENIETCMLKMTPDGKKRLWSTLHPIPWDGASSLAAENGEVFMLGHRDPQSVYIYDAATGKMLRKIDVRWDAAAKDTDASDMDLHEGVLAVAYAKRNVLRWLDPKTGKQLGSAEIPAPQGVAVGAGGTTYITTGDRIVRLTQANHTPVDVVTALAGVGRIDLDHSSGELLVYLSGTQQIKRFAPDGALRNTYGAAGGRKDGIYDDTTKRSFAGFADLAADGKGGFYVTESNAAPRRTAHFAADGSVIREWYGGQRWAPHAAPEPGNPNVLWVGSQYGWVMRVIADYAKKTWQVHSCYEYPSLARGLVGDSWNERGYYRIFEHAGSKYLVLEKMPTVLRIDEKNWKLVPVTVCGALGNAPAAWLKEWAGKNLSYQWNDANGDGEPQKEEMTFYAETLGSAFQPVVDDQFTCFFFKKDADAIKVHKSSVTRWNAVGGPIYGDLPKGVAHAVCPPRFNVKHWQDPRWSAFLHHDTATGDLYGAFNDWVSGWGGSADSFMQRWDKTGKSAWSVSRQGGVRTSIPGEIHQQPARHRRHGARLRHRHRFRRRMEHGESGRVIHLGPRRPLRRRLDG